jgi:hypothetical protein
MFNGLSNSRATGAEHKPASALARQAADVKPA